MKARIRFLLVALCLLAVPCSALANAGTPLMWAGMLHLVAIGNAFIGRADRAAYIAPAKAVGFRIYGYFFESDLAAALQRNARRDSTERVPEPGVRGANKALQPPSFSEGFDQLFAVRMDGGVDLE